MVKLLPISHGFFSAAMPFCRSRRVISSRGITVDMVECLLGRNIGAADFSAATSSTSW